MISERTPARLAWLRHLAEVGTAKRWRGSAGYTTARLGWTQRVLDFGDGPISMAEVEARYGARWWDRPHEFVGETLTEAGRAVLAEQDE